MFLLLTQCVCGSLNIQAKKQPPPSKKKGENGIIFLNSKHYDYDKLLNALCYVDLHRPVDTSIKNKGSRDRECFSSLFFNHVFLNVLPSTKQERQRQNINKGKGS